MHIAYTHTLVIEPLTIREWRIVLVEHTNTSHTNMNSVTAMAKYDAHLI